ncbi:phosphotransferase family protein [Yoonia maritima]|uniref:phosphotransferase family protein n=1 Tax=Yoonia maritima TaxID=1435347 RepID=UPI000D0E495F|nr:phosphotransferase family protein [Yoonia maritima]
MTTDTQNLDIPVITDYLSDHLPGFAGPLSVSKFQQGQSNPTFLLDTPTKRFVLRRKPPGQLLKSAHAVDREYRVQKALADSDVPVATMHHLCEDDSIIGSMFYIMDHVDGRNFNLPTLPDLTSADRGAVIREMNRVLAALHDIDIDARGLSDYGPPGNYFERQIGRWTKQYRASETEKLPAMDRLIDALNNQIPADDGQRTLVHGDYRIDNMMFAKDGTNCLAVLDWELSTIGHPYADLAAVIMQWQMPAGPEGRGLEGIDRGAHGLPSDGDFIAQYCDRRGIPEIANFGFYLSFCFFRMAAIIQGVRKRGMTGNASNPERAKKTGEKVPLFAQRGLEALEQA